MASFASGPGQGTHGSVRRALFVHDGVSHRFLESGDRPLLDLTVASMERLIVGNYINQVLLIQKVLPSMIGRGSGRIINMVSRSAINNPHAAAGEGGWGITATLRQRLRSVVWRVVSRRNSVRKVCGDSMWIRAMSLLRVSSPVTARIPLADGCWRHSSDSAEATAAVATWLSTHSEALDLAGDWIYAPELCEERNFLKVLARIRVPQPVDVDVLASAVSGMN